MKVISGGLKLVWLFIIFWILPCPTIVIVRGIYDEFQRLARQGVNNEGRDDHVNNQLKAPQGLAARSLSFLWQLWVPFKFLWLGCLVAWIHDFTIKPFCLVFRYTGSVASRVQQ